MRVFPPGMTAGQKVASVPVLFGGVLLVGLLAFTAAWERIVWRKKPPA